jgi:Thiamine pyrophosphate enzyme, C-terminal TPP binding domain
MSNPPIYEVLAHAFASEGVDPLFNLMGDGNMHWVTAMPKIDGIRVFHAGHEHCACAMAATRNNGKVVLIEGDGSLTMHIQELDTKRHGLRLLICVLNDGAYGAEIHAAPGRSRRKRRDLRADRLRLDRPRLRAQGRDGRRSGRARGPDAGLRGRGLVRRKSGTSRSPIGHLAQPAPANRPRPRRDIAVR